MSLPSKERGQSSLMILWSLRGRTSVPKAQQSRFPNSERPYVCLYKKHNQGGETEHRGLHWAEIYVAFSNPQDWDVLHNRQYKRHISSSVVLWWFGILSLVWGFFRVNSSQLERSRHPGPYSSCPSVCWRGQGSRETNQHPEKTNTIVSYSKYKGPWGTVIL